MRGKMNIQSSSISPETGGKGVFSLKSFNQIQPLCSAAEEVRSREVKFPRPLHQWIRDVGLDIRFSDT